VQVIGVCDASKPALDVELVLNVGKTDQRFRHRFLCGLGDIDLAGVRRDADADAALRLHTGFGDIAVAG